MSWGERSCIKPCRATKECSMGTCNVNCHEYKWDGETEPDSVHIKDMQLLKPSFKSIIPVQGCSKRKSMRRNRKSIKRSC